MRALAAGLLLVGVVLAGCADEPARGSTFPSSSAPDRPLLTEPLLQWRSLGASSVTLSPKMVSLDVVVPKGALTVVVNQTLDAGAAYGITITLGGCVWDRPQSFVGVGQTIGADCGGVSEGADLLQIATTAGAISARVEPVALVCEDGPTTWACPPRSPILTS